MAGTPKKRKRDDLNSSPSKSRPLDFFFGKQKQQLTQANGAVGNSLTPKGQTEVTFEENGGQELSDEALARQLQAQWEEEDRNLQNQQAGPTTDEVKPSVSTQDEAQPIQAVEDGTGTTEKGDSKLKTGNTLSLQSAAAAVDDITSEIPFDQSPLTFDPQEYIPSLQTLWKSDNGDMSYALLTRAFTLINSTQSRIKIVDTLVNLLRVVIEGDPSSLLPTVWLATNAISPPYISLELGLGGSSISKALKKTCGLDNASLKVLYDKHGDAGDVIAEAKKKQTFTLRKPKPLTVKGVYQGLVKIANSTGNGSGEIKQRILERLMQDAQGSEQSRYLVRTFSQHLRIGAVKTTMLIALSRAFWLSRPPGASFEIGDRKELAKLKKEQLAEVWARGEELVKASFAQRPNYNDLVPCLLEIGISDELLVRCGLALHIPLRPMLGSITRDLGEMLTKLQGRDFACEFKYDGQRAQVHCDEKGRVSIFSRHLEVMTEKYPDLVSLVPEIRGENVSSFILEGEVVAVDRATGDLKAFQTLTNRAKKDVAISAIKVDVCLFAFDLMYLNGQSLLERPFRERRELLRSLFIELPHKFTWVQSIDATSADSETVLEFFKAATDIKCEGIMVKVLDNVPNADLEDPSAEQLAVPPTPSKKGKKAAPKAAVDKAEAKEKGTRRKALLSTYEPDKRLDSWLKVKKDYNTAADTLDLIPIAGWHGQGRKAKWWSPILLAVRNPETGSLEAVTKCISGFTDKFYQANKEKYAEDGPNTIPRPSYIEYPGHPDVWFEPQEVWEMAFADITMSPTYLAAMGLVSEERGLSMRFPRFLKVREDKSIEEASTNHFLADLWFKQVERVKAEGGDVPVDPTEGDGEIDDD